MSEDVLIWQPGFVKGLSFVPYDKSLYSNILGFYSERQVECMFRSMRKKISAETHRYYRGVLLPCAQNSEMFRGQHLDKIHKYFAQIFLQDIEEMEVNGTTILVITTISTKDADQSRMNQFINDVRQFLAENNIITPDPIKI